MQPLDFNNWKMAEKRFSNDSFFLVISKVSIFSYQRHTLYNMYETKLCEANILFGSGTNANPINYNLV